MRSLFVSLSYLDVRAGRCALALKEHGITADALGFRHPPQFAHAYSSITTDPCMDWTDMVRRIRASKADVIHVHGELYGFWVAQLAAEAADGRPVILDIHDLTCARPASMFDPYEESGFCSADAYVWVTDEMRAFGAKMGLSSDKPSCIVTNYPSSSAFIDKPLLPHVGGVVCAGGIAKRGDDSGQRDHSAVCDALDGQLHLYPGAEPPDYGIMHEQEPRHELYIQRLATHDWGFSGHHLPKESWTQTLATRVGDYFAAGIPGIYMNSPANREFVECGMGIEIDSLKDLKRLPDPKPYRKAVLANRRQFTVERIIDPLVAMYKGLA